MLLPLPLRPTMPKISPGWTSKLMSSSAEKLLYALPRTGRRTRSLSVCICCSGSRKRFDTVLTDTAGGCGAPSIMGVNGSGR